jgi:rod shape-determining protein MreD
MIVTPKIFARLAAITILAVLLQLSFFSRVEMLQTSADILPVVVVSLGLLGGSMAGAVAGFSIGFLVDCLLVAPLGGTSLVLLGVGYLAGLFRERFDIHSALLPPLICMGATLLAEIGFAIVQVMLGVDAPVSVLIVRDMLLKSIYAFFLAWPIYFGLRRALRPALVEEPKLTRRRQPTVLGARRV